MSMAPEPRAMATVPGAHQLPDAEAAEQRDERVDLLLGAGVLDDERVRGRRRGRGPCTAR